MMMPRSLTWKLTLAFLLVAMTVALLVAAFIRLTSGDQLDQLIIEQRRSEFVTQVTNYYQANGSWAGVETFMRQYHGGPPTGAGVNFDPGDGRRPEPRLDRRVRGFDLRWSGAGR